jgi:hypothetical protein
MRRDVVSKAIVIAFVIVSLTAACALNMASSKLSYGDRAAVKGFPQRFAVATIVGNPPTGVDATVRLAQGLVDLGFDVVVSGADVDKIFRQWGYGVSETISDDSRKKLQETYRIDGLFVGTLSPDKQPLLIETRLSLKLISIPTGSLVWSANVLSQEIPGLSGGLKKTAVMLAEKALDALEKDLYPKPTKPAETPASSTLKKDQPEGSN